MKKKKTTGFRAVRFLFAALCLTGMAVIALFPFPNRSLSLHFIMDEREAVAFLNSRDIALGTCREIEFEKKMDETRIKMMRIYGSSRTMLLKESGSDELYRYIEMADQGEVQWTGTEVVLTGKDSIHFYLNEDCIKMLQQLSASFIQERVILTGLYLCLIFFILFLRNALKERNAEGNWSNHGPVFEMRQFWSDMLQYSQYMVYAARTDLKAEVANSYLNRLWWLLEPFFNMIVYVIVFGGVMGNSIENYATFVFSALLMWNFFNKTITFSVKLVRNSKDIITKVYIPKFILLLSNMILNMFKLIFSLIVLVAMMVVFRVHVGLQIVWVVPAYVVMLLLAFGAGMIFLHFGVYVDDLSYAVGILLNMLMFLSGTFYNVVTTLPEPLNGLMMSLNPLAVVIDTMRNALLYKTAANLPALAMWFLVSVILCCIGIHTVYQYENSYVKIV